MSFTCPHCTKEIPEAGSKSSFEERLGKLTDQKKDLEKALAKAEGLAKQAAPLAARANGFEFDEDALETLMSRFEKARKENYEGDFATWMSDAEKGAPTDKVAARFKVQTQAADPATPAKPQPAADPATPAKPALPTTSTTVAASPATQKLTPQQVAELNKPLMDKYKTAKPEERAALKAQMDANWAKTGDGQPSA